MQTVNIHRKIYNMFDFIYDGNYGVFLSLNVSKCHMLTIPDLKGTSIQ